MSARKPLYHWLAALILFPASILQAQTTSPLDLIKQETPPANERIAYGTDLLQFGELRLPAGAGPFPVAILVHGGCWSAKLGKLPERVVSFELLRPIAAALAKAGIASWNIEYRRLGNEGGLARHISGSRQGDGLFAQIGAAPQPRP